MIGFFMSYFVDSLTGVGLVDQMGNFFCKTLLFVAVAGVLFIRKNEDLDKLQGLFEETTLYDKQWQAAWKEPESSSSKKWTKFLAFFFFLLCDVCDQWKSLKIIYLLLPDLEVIIFLAWKGTLWKKMYLETLEEKQLIAYQFRIWLGQHHNMISYFMCI